MRNRMCFPAMAFHEIEVKVESAFRQSSDVKQLEQLGICLISHILRADVILCLHANFNTRSCKQSVPPRHAQRRTRGR